MKRISLSSNIPPMVLIGTVIVLFPIFTFMTMDRINRQKVQSVRLLMEKSTALIRAFEAGASSGMMNMGWNTSAMENLLTQTAALPDIVYLFIVDKNGRVLVHNDPQMIGKTYPVDLKVALENGLPGWRMVTLKNEGKVFEVHKKFTPLGPSTGPMGNRMQRMMHRNMDRMFSRHADIYEDTVIFVGLDMTPIAQADKSDTHHTILMAVILALIGFTGVVLVYLVQRYAAARTSLSQIQVFSDTLVENMPVGLIAADINNRIISVNPAAKSILGLEAETPDQKIDALLPEPLCRMLTGPHLPESLIEKQIQIPIKDHDPVYLDIVTSPLNDSEKNNLGTLLILRDRTEENRLKEQMEQNKRLAAVGRLAAGVAHEIRNPLSSLKGYATFFKEVFEPESDTFEIADTMTREVDRLNRVVSELVEFAKPVAVSRKLVNIENLLAETTGQMTFEPKAEKVKIKTDIAENLPDIEADEDRLRQVLLNLFLNAIQAMDGPGRLCVKADRLTEKNLIRIIVDDDGPGIPPENRPNIFEPYFTTKMSGTGLGLAIAHNIIKAHKGTIDVDSTAGQGTRFTILLPVKKEK